MGRFYLRPSTIRQWFQLRDYNRDRQRRLAGDDAGGEEPPIEPDTASALQTPHSETAILFTGVNNRYQVTTVIPAGDWTLGFWMRTDTAGCVFNSGPSSSPYTSNNNIAIFANLDSISVTGKDNAGANLGVSANSTGSSSARGIASRFYVHPGRAVFLVVRKTGNLIQLWLKWPGHAAINVGEEFTTFGACTLQAAYVGRDRSGGRQWKGAFRKLFFVSYALTEAQINAVAEGADPTTYGTPSATDYYFAAVPSGVNWTSTINSISGTFFLTGYGTATGIGNAALANGVYIAPDQPGKVYQRESNNRATVTLSGVYFGADAPIQVLPIDWATGVSLGNWTTIAASPTGGVWTGTIELPARAGWYKFQTRKVISGTPSTDVVTSDTRLGVGEVVMLLGQSLMDHIGSSAGGTDVTANGLWSQSQLVGPLVSGIGQEYVPVTGTSNVGGQIQITSGATPTAAHGRKTGQRMRLVSVGGTTEANGEWIITVTGINTFILNGSTYTNAWTSGGFAYFVQPKISVADNALMTVPASTAIFANYLTTSLGCVVEVINRAYGAAAIEGFNSYTYAAGVGGRATLTVLHSKHAQKVGAVLWLHGQANIGSTGYFSDGGSSAAWTGYGQLGVLQTFLKAEFPNNDFDFGVAAFTQAGGRVDTTNASVHEYRHGMHDWTVRKRAAGDLKVFFLGWYNDLQPMWENGVVFNSHYSPPNYKRFGARLAQSFAKHKGGTIYDAVGPRIISASRSGAVITLTVQQNGGTGLRVGRTGARPSGFAVSANDFASNLTINNVEILSATSIRITLSADPGAAVKVRYQYGYVGNYATSAYFTPRITGAANNGSGAIRITVSTTAADVTPNGSQAAGGHGLIDGQWIGIQEVAGTIEANGIWEVDVIDSQNFDLIGSTFTNAYVAGGLYSASASGTVLRELGVPIYDDRTIGGYDAAGAPLAPTHTALTAA